MQNIQKFLALTFFISAVSSCAGHKFDSEDSKTEANKQQVEERTPDVPQEPQKFDAVDSKAAADVINQETQAAIEEVEVADRVFFDLNSSTLSDDATKLLDTQASWLKSDTSIKIILEGHCDERGTREYNIALGEKRADAAKKYLVDNGVTASRIKIISYGKERPAFLGDSEEIWSKNRRAVTVMEE